MQYDVNMSIDYNCKSFLFFVPRIDLDIETKFPYFLFLPWLIGRPTPITGTCDAGVNMWPWIESASTQTDVETLC